MTLALIGGAFTDEARGCLEREFGWRLVTLPDIRSAIPLDGSAFDPAAVEALVVEAQPVTAETFAAMPSLRVLACLRGDPVNVDLEAATSRGVPVLCTPGRNRESVADFVFGLLLSVTRHIAGAHHLIMTRELTEARRGRRCAPAAPRRHLAPRRHRPARCRTTASKAPSSPRCGSASSASARSGGASPRRRARSR